MAKVLQRLARRGLLTSHQGTRGGYRLARARRSISVADIIQAIDGPLTVTACSTEAENCGQYAKCSVRDPLWRIKDRIVVGAGDLLAAGDRRRSADRGRRRRRSMLTLRRRSLMVPIRSISITTPRRRSIRACSRRCCRTSPSEFGNPASRQHAFGWEAQEAVDRARAAGRRADRRVRRTRSSSPAAPANPTTSRSRASRCALRDRGDHVVTVATEHKSVLDSFKRLERDGWRVTRLGVDGDGFIDLDALRAAVTDKTVLVSVMAANNEIGVLQPLAEIGAIVARARRAAPHRRRAGGRQDADRRQRDGHRPAVADRRTSTTDRKARARSTSAASKPAFRSSVRSTAAVTRRASAPARSTSPASSGSAAPRPSAAARWPTNRRRLSSLRDRLLEGLRAGLDGVRVNGSLARRLPHNLHVSFDRIEGEALLMALGDLAVSTGSACSSGSQAPSHVLQAIGAVGEAPAPRSASASAARPPTPTSTSRSTASRRSCSSLRRALAAT